MTTQDLYPTRLGQEVKMLERHDPVVWGSGEGSALTAAQVESYECDGYLQLPALFSESEVEAFQEEIAKLTSDRELLASERVIIEPDEDSLALRSVFDVHREGMFRDLVRDERVSNVARQLLGSDVYIHQSRINLKPPFRGKEFFWHSDFETWHAEDGMPSMRALSASVSLTENVHSNGPLMVIPGSHKHFVACGGETPAEHHRESLRRQEIGVPSDEMLTRLADESEVRNLVGPIGSVTFFDCNLMHGSNGNITPQARRNVFFVYNSVHNTLVEPFAAPARRPNHIAARNFEAVPLPVG
ncbi:MAG: ectoine hydroxylase [Acidimicrobiia bacterium]